jgi:hypothetical protein
MSWAHIWNRVKAVPVGVWAALGVALSLLLMYLRGRRLEAELAAEKLKSHAADAAAQAARSEGKAQVHMEVAAKHESRAEELSEAAKEVRKLGVVEQKRIAALPPSKVTSEYLKLAAQEKAR